MMIAMTIQAVVFDIGGVLEINRDLGVTGRWESWLDLGSGELNERMADVWRGGSIGTIMKTTSGRRSANASAWTAGR
jgi:putative hydrolase of the HAD superfamily